MLGILLGLIIIMGLAYLGWSIIWVAPIAAGVVALTGGLDLLSSYTGPYMSGFVGFAKSWFPVFMLGAIFGKLMESTKMANSVALMISKIVGKKQAILGIWLAAAILTYGGVSLFVVVFTIYPLALSLFREANIPRRLIPGCIALGAFTFTMVALPGSPQIQNLIPMKYFHTTPTAAPVMGIIAAIIMAVGGHFYLIYREKRLRARGEVFDEPQIKAKLTNETEEKAPHFVFSILPLIAVVLALNLAKIPIVPSLLLGIILIMILSFKNFKHFIGSINDGANSSLIAIINTSAAVGFGSVIKIVPGFETLTHLLMGIKGSPLISEAIAINILAGATGSASGGMGIALEALGDKYYQIAEQQHLSLELFHRVASISSGGLDVLPHNGAVLTLLAVTSMTHKKSYLDIAVVAIVLPIIALIVVIFLSSLGFQ
ncbi:GntP family permease [Helicobacter sp. 11S03491-1]|uniref:GntP family permease n=1 Tax=Helicobacter sp. 11S03491-1 TaxID=1476196 RepID=UPI000BA68D9D|nr:GntP family permease [Helicobacter sp. 11S03491-1]PAF42555.1 transporter [Helicobacter sp. 11S03491-1]